MFDLIRYGVSRAIVHLFALAFLTMAPAALAREMTIVAFGDSLTAGYGLKPGEGFAPRLEAMLRAQRIAVRVQNAGVSGDTSAAGKARINWVFNAMKSKPDLVILELGGNDMLRGIRPAQTRTNLDAIVSEFKRRGIPVLIAGMLASPNMGPSFSRDFNDIYPALAKKHRARLYPFFMQGVAGNRRLLLADGIHPNAQGVNVIAKSILPHVKASLGK